MSAPRTARLVGAMTVATWSALVGAATTPPTSSAAPCPDVDVTFARATGEPPGVGQVGQEFINALRTRAGNRSIAVYAVNYPATEDFVPSANAGTEDANAHVNGVAASCPNTKLVLGGYSQGALVIDQITIAQAPVAGFVPDILTAEVAGHVAALALFGNPSDRFLGAPVSTVSPWYGAKAIDLCAPGDPVCTPGAMFTAPTPEEMRNPAHLSYPHSGMPTQAADFVASHL
ncbi:cutinase family protein [Mycobacterium paraterrae]|uniref:Cutinase n=1 Tax=Mycobacterium paraterrae TaxID=577492 RepID=A0ABY3VQ27_9MYCO|nr:cutinase family protein [Mycobacterium paraterrae]UMB71561.1 cutinase family protein [Mycobacterium paraterrae]